MTANVYCALVHHPVLGREGEVLTTAVTNMDVHDIARSARTFGLRGYFVVTPVTAQRDLVHRILDHWRTGPGGRRIPARAEALALVETSPSLDAAIDAVTRMEGTAPRTVVTAARAGAGSRTVSFARLRTIIATTDVPTLLVFGTGHGLADSVLESASLRLEPIVGRSPWNHLSVRAAAAIVFDRLLAPPSIDAPPDAW